MVTCSPRQMTSSAVAAPTKPPCKDTKQVSAVKDALTGNANEDVSFQEGASVLPHVRHDKTLLRMVRGE
jgi:hypothetical protein